MKQPPQSTDRQIRVFISSTFRDMQEERDILIKKIFPQLRKLCEERAVTWTEVDLRWGITTEQAAEGKVLPLCLEEIHRCRPYFIGLLGGRYGWVPEPDSIPADLLESQPWLKQHLDHSVTELEILHGVFSEEPMHGHAYFYFRDPKYLESVPTEKRQDFTTENAEAEVKLAKLKQKIRGARDEHVCELRENYSTPEQLGEWILEDFTKLIERLYPKDQTPDPLDQEAARHEAYARGRRLAFVGREDLLCRLSEHCATPGNPIVITGESGCGKSALLAEWVARWRKAHPDDLIIQHYIGSTPDSADWQGLVRRILSELTRAFAITDEIPVQPDALRGALNDWTVKAAGSRRVVLVLDALNQLAEDGAARQLGWLPVVFPANFHVVVSTLPGESLDALSKRAWPELNVPLFARADIAPAALAYFKIFSKTPSPDIVERLESTSAACNALYLRAVLDELRQFGKHEELTAKADAYISAPDLPDLFDLILARWHDDFGKDSEHPDLVRRLLCLVSCARHGLSERELLDLLHTNRRALTPFLLAAESSVVFRAGLICLSHQHLRSAIERRYFSDLTVKHAFHLELADYFLGSEDWECHRLHDLTPRDRRSIGEHPWHLVQAENWGRLGNLISDLNFITVLWAVSESDLLNYCAKAETNSEFSLDKTFCADIRQCSDSDKHKKSSFECLVYLNTKLQWKAPSRYVQTGSATGTGTPVNTFRVTEPLVIGAQMFVLSSLLRFTGHWEESRILRGMLLEFNRASGNPDSIQAGLHNLGVIKSLQGDIPEALKLHEKEVRICREINDSKALGEGLRSVGIDLRNLGQHEEALTKFREAQRLAKGNGDPRGQMLALFDQANVFLHLGEPDKAEPLIRTVLDMQKANGLMETVEVTSMIGVFYQARGDYRAALREFSKLVASHRELGQVHELGIALHNMAGCHAALEEYAQALQLLREEEHLCRQLQDQHSLAANLHDQSRMAERSKESPCVALTCLREALRIQKETGTQITARPEWLAEAVFLCAQTIEIDEALGYIHELGDGHPPQDRVESWVAAWMILATAFASREDHDRAKALLAQAEPWCAECQNAELRRDFEVAKSVASHESSASSTLAAALENDDPTIALDLFERLIADCRRHEDSSGELQVLLLQVQWLVDRGQLNEAQSLCHNIEQTCAGGSQDSVLAACRKLQARIARHEGRPDEALRKAQEAANLTVIVGDEREGARSKIDLALALDAKGDRVGALRELNIEEDCARSLNDEFCLEKCLGNKAAILADLGQPQEAVDCLADQEVICKGKADAAGLGQVKLNQGILHVRALGQIDEGIKLLVEAIRLCRKECKPKLVHTGVAVLKEAAFMMCQTIRDEPFHTFKWYYMKKIELAESVMCCGLECNDQVLLQFGTWASAYSTYKAGDKQPEIRKIARDVRQSGLIIGNHVLFELGAWTEGFVAHVDGDDDAAIKIIDDALSECVHRDWPMEKKKLLSLRKGICGADIGEVIASDKPEKLARKLTVLNSRGLYTSPSALIVKCAKPFQRDTELYFTVNDEKVDGHSIMGLMMLGARQDNEVLVEAEGIHARIVIERVTSLFNNGFGLGEPCIPIPCSHSEWITQSTS